MQVVLTKDVSNLGRKGEIVDVKGGYFRNYLGPKSLADFATPGVIKTAALRKEKALLAKEAILQNAKDLIEKAEGVSVDLSSKASSKGKLYAAITSEDVAKEIGKKLKIDLNADFVVMDPIKEVGEFTAILRFAEGSETEVKVIVSAE